MAHPASEDAKLCHLRPKPLISAITLRRNGSAMQTESHPSDTSLKEPLKAHANSKISSMSEASPSLDASWMRKPTASYTWNVEVGILYSCQARLAVPATASCSEAMNMSAFSTFVSLWSLPRSQHGLHSCREPSAPRHGLSRNRQQQQQQ